MPEMGASAGGPGPCPETVIMDPDTGPIDAPWLEVREYVSKTSGEPKEPWWFCLPREKWAAPTRQISADHIDNVKNEHLWWHNACPQGSDEEKAAWCSKIMNAVVLHSSYAPKRKNDGADDWRSSKKPKPKSRESREQWQSEGHQQEAGTAAGENTWKRWNSSRAA